MVRRVPFVFLVAAAAIAAACASDPKGQRYSRAELKQSLAGKRTPGLVIGEFPLAYDPILDGDTIKVRGIESSLRLLALDTEETFKNKRDRRDAESDFDAYLEEKRAESSRPIKVGTPMGEQAKDWAKEYFPDVDTVRLERDHPKEIRGRFDRYLVYVFAFKNGAWQNYNVECVRAGMSPYFTKYSYSRRFHDQFVAAEKEARAAGRGIWNPASQGYGDYDVRKTWWDARADFIKEFERRAQGSDNHIVLTNFDALDRLEARVDREVTLLGAVAGIRGKGQGPTRVFLARRQFHDFPVIFFDRDVFQNSGISRYRSEFVTVTGVVSAYENRYTDERQLQIVVNTPTQITGSRIPTFEPNRTAANNE